ncbi:hypothetical protein BSKO_10566 [Bryopsis sp. KO-2023]|nr:hypothetical protein BSKO_10566 [Bryopsis sp. KO-2023]
MYVWYVLVNFFFLFQSRVFFLSFFTSSLSHTEAKKTKKQRESENEVLIKRKPFSIPLSPPPPQKKRKKISTGEKKNKKRITVINMGERKTWDSLCLHMCVWVCFSWRVNAEKRGKKRGKKERQPGYSFFSFKKERKKGKQKKKRKKKAKEKQSKTYKTDATLSIKFLSPAPPFFPFFLFLSV